MKRTLLFISILSLFFACQDCPDCPTPPVELQFRIVDVTGQDLTVGETPQFNRDSVRLTYDESGVERETLLELDTFRTDRTIFKATFVSLLASRGIEKYTLYINNQADELETNLLVINTVCCEYKLYEFLTVNGNFSPYSQEDDYVFLIQK